MQIVLVILIVLVCFFFTGLHIYRSIAGKDDPCSGCDGCTLKREKMRKCKENGNILRKNKQKHLAEQK